MACVLGALVKSRSADVTSELGMWLRLGG